jgi:hypothetical protein
MARKAVKKSRKKKKRNDNAANLGFEDKLWAAADKLRRRMDTAVFRRRFSHPCSRVRLPRVWQNDPRGDISARRQDNGSRSWYSR